MPEVHNWVLIAAKGLLTTHAYGKRRKVEPYIPRRVSAGTGEKTSAGSESSSNEAGRVFHESVYQTRQCWSRARRVVAKAEYLEKREDPRFIVTSLGPQLWRAQPLYEEHYCARGTWKTGSKNN